MQMHQPVHDAGQPVIGIALSGEVAVARVEVDADGGTGHELADAVEARGRFAVLLVGLEADQDAARLGDLGGLHQRVAHQHEILRLGGPRRLGAFIGVDHRRAALGGAADRLLEPLRADFRLGGMGLESIAAETFYHHFVVLGMNSFFHIFLLAVAPDAQRIVEQRDAMEITRLTQQFAPPMDHRLDVCVAEFRGLGDAPLEGFVVMPDEFHVNADVDFVHVRVRFLRWVCGLRGGGQHRPRRAGAHGAQKRSARAVHVYS